LQVLVAKDALMKHLQGKTPEMVQQHLSMLRLDLEVYLGVESFKQQAVAQWLFRGDSVLLKAKVETQNP
jgi:hypothetical protein